MTATEMFEALRTLIEEGHGEHRLLLTDIDPDGTGTVYEPTEVGLLLGDDDRAWIGIDLRLADTGEGDS
ncbi:hypothetical protein AB0I72_19810 [Nocardiopsis sp. NPDC049922]|uniref:hypothetical protein n=1 Tax=Nocardiopsis sp. NPDC049922 TaxID=3155157 RepID=UPI0033E49A33